MTAPTSTPAAPTTADRTPEVLSSPEACDACPHPAEAHDVIGTRFCGATVLGALTRGCICRS